MLSTSINKDETQLKEHFLQGGFPRSSRPGSEPLLSVPKQPVLTSVTALFSYPPPQLDCDPPHREAYLILNSYRFPSPHSAHSLAQDMYLKILTDEWMNS